MSDEAKTNGRGEAILIAGATGFAYLVAYRYEEGYVGYFGVPRAFVDVSFSATLYALLAVAFATFSFFLGVDFLVAVARSSKATARNEVFLKLGFLALISVLWITVDPSTWRFQLGLLAFVAMFLLGLPLLTQRGESGYANKLEAHHARQSESQGLLEDLRDSLGPTAFLVLILCVQIANISRAIGTADARRARSFTVVASEPEMVLLRQYGDFWVGARLDREAKTVSRQFRVLGRDDLSGLALQVETIGPLRPEEEE